MTLIAYDPYTSPAKAGQLGARLVGLDELLAESDFITVHLPKTPETVGLIGEEALRKVKPTVRIINAARGGIVDEQALADAIGEGRVAGAGLDVFAKEPTTESPLFAYESVVVTPHLGASTDEAQEKAGVSVARSVRLALGGDLVPDAVNVSGGRDRRGGPPRHRARREAGPHLHGRRRSGAGAARHRRARRDHRARRVGLAAVGAEGPVPGRRRGAGLLRQRARSSPSSAAARPGCSPTRRAATSATSRRCAAPSATARSSPSRARSPARG